MFLGLLSLSVAQAGPWVKDPGHAYAKAGYVRFAADEYVDTNGQVVGGTRYVGHTSHVYGEVGVLPKVQLVLNVPYVGARNVVDDLVYVNRQLGDADFGLEAGHSFGDVPVSLQVLAKVPLYDTGDLAQYGLLAGRFPAMGDGQVDLTTTAAVGRGLAVGEIRGWVAGELGYRHRTEAWLGDSTEPERELVDGITWRTQLGWSPRFGDWDAGWLSLDASGIQNLEVDDVTKQYTQAGASVGIKTVEGLAVELGFSQMLSARASSLGSSVSGGISWSR